MFHNASGIEDRSTVNRRADIRRLLVEHRRELLNEIQTRVRDIREDRSSTNHYAAQPGETLDAEPEDDLVFALIQMKGEMLERVNAAVRQLDNGTYGHCADCGEPIASSRLRAMPFAVRCRDCEEAREHDHCLVRGRLHSRFSELGLRH